MIQDIFPYVYDNQYKNAVPDSGSRYVLAKNRSVLLKEADGELDFPKAADIPEGDREYTYLFSISGQTFFLITDDAVGEALESAGFEYRPIGTLQSLKPRWICFAAITAYQLANWYRINRFCGCCGKPTRKDSVERMLYCDNCKNMIFPKICPAVIVGITNGEKLLLTRRAGSKTGNYSLVSGFAEIGESIEDTVRREVMEEVGLKVKNIRYYKSQQWSLSDSLLFGFFCDVDGSDHVDLEERELALAVWTDRGDVPRNQNQISLTAEMITVFGEGKA